MSSKNKQDDIVGKYTIKKFSRNRQILADIYDEFLKKHYMTGLLEVNVTTARQLIREFEIKTSERISFASWVAKCIADSAEKYPEINSFRKGKSKLILFEDVDVIVMIEKKLKDKVIPVPYSIRRCNKKNLLDISREIKNAQIDESTEKDQLLEQGWILNLYNILPKFIRQRIVRRMIKNPFYIKKNGGLIVLTSISMFINNPGWVIGFGGMLTMSVSLGGKTFRKVGKEGMMKEQEFLHLTIDIDHDIIDGAPATRFVNHLVKLVEEGYLLNSLN